jgi:hypothetical protein
MGGKRGGMREVGGIEGRFVASVFFHKKPKRKKRNN